MDYARQVIARKVQLLQLRKGGEAFRQRARQMVRACGEAFQLLELVEIRGQCSGQRVLRHSERNQSSEFDHLSWERTSEFVRTKLELLRRSKLLETRDLPVEVVDPTFEFC